MSICGGDWSLSSLWMDPVYVINVLGWIMTQPGLILVMMLPIIHVLSLRRKEKKLYGIKVEAPTPLVLRIWLFGIATGILCSGILATWTWNIHQYEVYLIWALTFFLSLFRVRFACLAYSVGILSICSLWVNQIGIQPVTAPWNQWGDVLVRFSIGEWIILVGFLHLMEGALIRLNGARGIHPVRLKLRKKNLVNGFLLAKGWPIPLMLFSKAGWLPLPVFLSYSFLNLSKPSDQQQRLASTLTMIYGMFLLLEGIFLAEQVIGQWLGAIGVLIGHEGIYQWSRWKERRNEPLYTSNGNGIRVLAVLPRSPAKEMGIQRGDIIQRINGLPILTTLDLEKTTQQSAFCKIEVLDYHLNRHIMQKALYENDPRDLGIIGAEHKEPIIKNNELTNFTTESRI